MRFGALAQLGERLHGMEEVESSILLRSTKSSIPKPFPQAGMAGLRRGIPRTPSVVLSGRRLKAGEGPSFFVVMALSPQGMIGRILLAFGGEALKWNSENRASTRVVYFFSSGFRDCKSMWQ